jgi:B9 domain-containing protein 2
MAELHITGMLMGGHGFASGHNGLYCKWRIVDDPSTSVLGKLEEDNWHKMSGLASGQTQVASVEDGDGSAIWQHPIDIHYATNSVRGWPRLYLEVWRIDSLWRHELESYGFLFIPTAPGAFELDIATVCPESPQRMDQISEYFVGAKPKLEEPERILRGGNRAGLHTRTCGVVQIELQLLHRGFEIGNVQFTENDVDKDIE